MGEKTRALSLRLQMLAKMVTPGSRVADIGCDHGFLSIHLVQEGISPAVIAMDVRKGPLSAAREHIAARGLGAYIETRLSDGLKKLKPGEVDTVVCAGMGGRLMERILKESREKTEQLSELILQPQSELQEFREFLHKSGFRVTGEDMVREDGKYYFAMRAVPENREMTSVPGTPKVFSGDGMRDRNFCDRICDKFGKELLSQKHPLLEEYLLNQQKILVQLIENLAAQDTERAGARLKEVQEELDDIQKALELF